MLNKPESLQKDFSQIYSKLLPEGFVKGYADCNTNTGYVALKDGKYTFHSNNWNTWDFTYEFDTLEEIEEALISFDIIDEIDYELTADQYIIFTKIL